MRDEGTYKIIGAAIEVHKDLPASRSGEAGRVGSGFLEAVYQEALGKVPAYKGKVLDKTYQPDFIFYEEILVEIKAISHLTGLEEAQIINYLKASGCKTGLLLNFGSQSLEYKRLVYNLRESA